MQVALLSTFTASKKEPLVTMANRVRDAFLRAGLGEPSIRFNLGDAFVPGLVSSVARVLRQHPELERFVTDADPMPGVRGARRISNGPLSAGSGERVPYETLQAIVAKVPRSFPFHSVLLHFGNKEFGTLGPVSPSNSELLPGVLLSDSWWVNGRVRSLSACTLVDVDPSAKRLPPLPPAVAAVLEACGKLKRTVQAPVPDEAAAARAIPVRLPIGARMASANPAVAEAVKPIVLDYRARMGEIVQRAHLPYKLPPSGQEMPPGFGLTAGPRKPALEGVFKPMGYSCQGGSGSFTLRRRTAANLTVELYMDVGTWSHFVLPIFRVLGIGFKASLMLPVAEQAAAGSQYPIASAEQWQKIVENLGALVQELDRTFVPDIERAAGPTPEWYRPES